MYFHRELQALLGVVALSSAAISANADSPTKVYPTAEEIQPIKVGATVPEVNVTTLEGKEVALRDLVSSKPSVIVFYRGGWCPFCNAHLKELKDAMTGLKELGYQMLAVSPDAPEAMAATKEKGELPYTLLSDTDVEAAATFGIAFQMDPATIEKYKGYNIDLSGSEWRLPVPAVFITRADGTIAYVHAEPDYKKRLSSTAVLDAAREALPSEKQ